MKYFVSLITAVLLLVMFCMPVVAKTTNENRSWDVIFASDLAKIKVPKKTDGLGFSITEEESLDLAIKKAIDNGGPACEAAKMAVDLNFNPYSVLMGVFKSGGIVKLDQLCMCATEIGGSTELSRVGFEDAPIDKSIMKQAADDAVANNLLRREEVSQAQCLEQGLAYTPDETGVERVEAMTRTFVPATSP